MYIDNNTGNIYIDSNRDMHFDKNWVMVEDIPKLEHMWRDKLISEEDAVKTIQKIITNNGKYFSGKDYYAKSTEDRSVHFEIPHIKQNTVIKSKITRKPKKKEKEKIKPENQIVFVNDNVVKDAIKQHLRIEFKPMHIVGGFDYSNQMRYAVALYYDNEEISKTTMAINL